MRPARTRTGAGRSSIGPPLGTCAERINSISPVAANVIDCRPIAARVRAEVADEVRAFTEQTGRVPGLATFLVGDDPASAVYVSGKQRACAVVGMESFDRRLPADASFEEVAQTLADLNADEAVSGVLLQLPVPDHLDGPVLTGTIDPAKDVDGLTPVNAGLLSLGLPGLRPCTPVGVLEILADVGVSLAGRDLEVVLRDDRRRQRGRGCRCSS